MHAVWCKQCGKTRWSLLAVPPANVLEAPCELCGGEMLTERRRPGAGPGRLEVERRRSALADRIAGADAPSLTPHSALSPSAARGVRRSA